MADTGRVKKNNQNLRFLTLRSSSGDLGFWNLKNHSLREPTVPTFQPSNVGFQKGFRNLKNHSRSTHFSSLPRWSRCGLAVVSLWSRCGLAVVSLWSVCGREVVSLWSCCGPAVVSL